MKDKIKEVELYFRKSLTEGDFKIKERDTYLIKLLIQDEYHFTLWIANEVKSLHLHNEFGSSSYMQFELSEKEKESIWNQLFKEERHKEGVSEKRDRLLKAKNKIEEQLKSIT